MPTVDVNGTTLAYDDTDPDGAGRAALVFSHSLFFDRSMFAHQVARFRDEYRVITYDHRGQGGSSPAPVAEQDMDTLTCDAAALIEHLDLGPTHVLGNSMGGFIAATFALIQPARTLSLGLCDAAGVTATTRNALEEGILAGGRNPFLMDDPSQFASFYAMTMAKPPFVPGLVKRSMALDYVRRREQLSEVFEQFYGQFFLDDRLGDITAPTLVLWGSEDQLVDPSCAAVWTAGISGARSITYDGIGHMPMLEVPRRCARDYREFLASV